MAARVATNTNGGGHHAPTSPSPSQTSSPPSPSPSPSPSPPPPPPKKKHHGPSPFDFDHRHTSPPRRQHVLLAAAAQTPLPQLMYPHQPMSLSGISLRAFVLGSVFSSALLAGLLTRVLTASPLWRIPFFVAALSLFHFLEFWTTAARNTPQATVSAFLLTANWPAYPIAHLLSCLECLVTHVLLPGRHRAPSVATAAILFLGLAMVLAGQAVRSLAMLHAGTSFNHTVQTKKADSHTLVTTGVYALLRHPSYFGFFYWGLGTQLVLGNTFCFFAYGYVLWVFFRSRVRVEEAKLIDFFGDEYVAYRARVGTMMPFVG